MLSSAYCFNFRYPFFSLRSFGSCLSLLPPLSPISLFPSIFPSKKCLEGSSYERCLQSIYPSFFLLCIKHPFHPWIYGLLLHFSHDLSNLSSPSFSSTIFQNFSGIYNLFPEVRTNYFTSYEHIYRMADGRWYKQMHERISQRSRKNGRWYKDGWRGCVTVTGRKWRVVDGIQKHDVWVGYAQIHLPALTKHSNRIILTKFQLFELKKQIYSLIQIRCLYRGLSPICFTPKLNKMQSGIKYRV